MNNTITSKELKEALWETMKDLKRKKIDAKMANAMATQSREILRVVKMELQILSYTGSKAGKAFLEFTDYEKKTDAVQRSR